jgi:glycosyltransferase involved in cell wall biosynthesis
LFDASDQELAHVYSTCSQALVLPSLAEGFGLPLVEARMRGCPVIASDLQALKELADEGVSFYHRNSLEELAALLVEQASFEKRSRSTLMPCFTWKNSAEQLIQVLTGR